MNKDRYEVRRDELAEFAEFSVYDTSKGKDGYCACDCYTIEDAEYICKALNFIHNGGFVL